MTISSNFETTNSWRSANVSAMTRPENFLREQLSTAETSYVTSYASLFTQRGA